MTGCRMRIWDPTRRTLVLVYACFGVVLSASFVGAESQTCVDCHRRQSPALVMEWQRSRHAAEGVSCIECHAAAAGEPDGWLHEGAWVSALVTPKDCAQCHDAEVAQFSSSHHARGGEILASLDNVLAEKVAGLPHNKADAVNGCLQCHGSIIRFARDAKGQLLRDGDPKTGKPRIEADT